MTAPEPKEIRRAAVERLAAAVRALGDATAETGVDPDSLDGITAEIAALTQRLAAVTHDGPYSGLTWAPGDFSVPEGPMPLNPIIGACSPVRPDVQLRFSNGEIVGRAMFTKRFVGPPGYAHGGISALLGEQIVAASGQAVGVRTITKSLRVRYRRPLPLGEEVTLWGVYEPDGDSLQARFTISARDEVAVEGTGELVTFERLEERTAERTAERKNT
jgi:acyl-coenzyme A thioesterase PaaI-like protein